MQRESKLLNKLRANEVVLSYKVNTSCPRVCEIAAMSGFDVLWTCMEHCPNDYSVIEKQIAAAKMHDTDMIVRVQRGGYSHLIIPLEMDASAIMVPHVMSAEDARQIAWRTRFHPVGRRPADGGNADGAYCMVPAVEYMEFVNKNRAVIAQIEDPEAMDELDNICQVEGIDIIFFGPGDYSCAIGHPWEFDRPEIIEAREQVAATARKYGKFAGTVGSAATIDEYSAMGYNLINIGADVVGLSQNCAEILNKAKKAQYYL